MEGFFTQLPQTPYGWVAFLGFVIFAIVQLALLVRRNDIQTLRSSNEYLRQRDEDREKEIGDLRKKVEALTAELRLLSNTNKTLQDLVVIALEHHFKKNPQVADKTMSELIRHQQGGETK